MSIVLTPPARLIDPRGQRFAAGLSAVILVAAYGVGATWVVAAVAIAMGASSALGTRYWLLGRPWPLIRRALRLGSVAPEHEYPPRFAQAIGTTFLGVAVVLFLLGATALAWIPVAGVVALQALLALTGYCLGCRLYFLRWWVPGLFARVVGGRAAAGTTATKYSRLAPAKD
jgi:hypothetical protein